jgi:hypothetical protein
MSFFGETIVAIIGGLIGGFILGGGIKGAAVVAVICGFGYHVAIGFLHSIKKE